MLEALQPLYERFLICVTIHDTVTRFAQPLFSIASCAYCVTATVDKSRYLRSPFPKCDFLLGLRLHCFLLIIAHGEISDESHVKLQHLIIGQFI
jgi:hypothetical protein